MEDVTDPELMRLNPKIDRSVCLYGYVRGVHFRNKASIHIPGKRYEHVFFVLVSQLDNILHVFGCTIYYSLSTKVDLYLNKLSNLLNDCLTNATINES